MSDRTVAGHPISGITERCTICGRSVNDVMSAAGDNPQVGDDDIAHFGKLTELELTQINAEKARRERIKRAIAEVSVR